MSCDYCQVTTLLCKIYFNASHVSERAVRPAPVRSCKHDRITSHEPLTTPLETQHRYAVSSDSSPRGGWGGGRVPERGGRGQAPDDHDINRCFYEEPGFGTRAFAELSRNLRLRCDQ